MKLSIITINYNNKQGLEETINSVISQTFTDYEYIVIDGDSTDGSKDLISKYSSKINFWVSESDNGIYHAMNKGIKQAKGEYLHFLNSGDYYYKENSLAEIFKKDINADIIRCDFFRKNNHSLQKSNNYGEEGLSLLGFKTQTYCHQAIFIKKELFELYGYYDEQLSIASDWKHIVISLLHGATEKYINETIVIYDETGISSNASLTTKEYNSEWNKILPPVLIKDYNKLVELNNEVLHLKGNYLTCFMFENKIPLFLMKALRKLYVILNIK